MTECPPSAVIILPFPFFSLSLPPRHRAIYFFNVCNELNVFPRDLPFFSVVFPFASRCYQSPPRTLPRFLSSFPSSLYFPSQYSSIVYAALPRHLLSFSTLCVYLVSCTISDTDEIRDSAIFLHACVLAYGVQFRSRNSR